MLLSGILKCLSICVKLIIQIIDIGLTYMHFTLRQLEIFAAVARHESVSRAAQELALSQSAASTALQDLERQFDCRLFDRMGKRLKLNALGRDLLPRAVSLLDEAEELEALMQGRTLHGTLQLGATLTIGNYLATLLMGDFMQQHQEARIQLHVDNTAHIVEQVLSFELDMGMIEGETHHSDLHITPWLEDELVVFCAPDHPLAHQDTPSEATLRDNGWILREPGSGTRRAFDQALGDDADQLNVRMELEHTEAIKRAVESGMGIGCVSRLALREAFKRGSLVPLATPNWNLKRRFAFIHHRQKYQTGIMQAFFNHCQQATGNIRSTEELVWSQMNRR